MSEMIPVANIAILSDHAAAMLINTDGTETQQAMDARAVLGAGGVGKGELFVNPADSYVVSGQTVGGLVRASVDSNGAAIFNLAAAQRNAAAMQHAIDVAVSTRRRYIFVPGGDYAITKVSKMVSTKTDLDIYIGGHGARFFGTAATSTSESGVAVGDPFFEIGSTTTTGGAVGFARKVVIDGIGIFGTGEFAEPTAIANRVGIRCRAIQYVEVRNSWIVGINYAAVQFDTVYDSKFENNHVYKAGRSVSTAQGTSMSGTAPNRFAIEFSSSLGDNTNAIVMRGNHLEGCPLFLYISMPSGYVGPSVGPREIIISNNKFEQMTTNYSEISPVYVGPVVGEIAMTDNFFTQNVYPVITGQAPPAFIFSAQQTTTDSTVPSKSVTISGSFKAPTHGAIRPLAGHYLTVLPGTVFNNVASTGTSSPVFDLGDHCFIDAPIVTFSKDVTDTPSLSPRCDVVRFFGKGSKVRDARLRFPSSNSNGALITLASTAGAGNAFTGWRPVSGRPNVDLVRESGVTNLDGIIELDNSNQGFASVINAPTPSVFGREQAVLSGKNGAGGAETYTDFSEAFIGQNLLLKAGDTSTIKHTANKLNLKGNADASMPVNAWIMLRRAGGQWYEVGRSF